MLNEELFPQLINAFGNQLQNGRFSRIWWAQDGAPAHTSVAVREWMTEFFGPRIIALHRSREWPPRSPDLTLCDFFLWGYLKSRIYATPPQDLDDLKQKITREADAVRQNPRLVKRAVRDMIRRAQDCVAKDGGHVRGTHN